MQIEQQLNAARSDVDAARASAAATQQELNDERRSRLAAEKLVAELRSKLDAMKQSSSSAPSSSGTAKAAVAAVVGGNAAGAPHQVVDKVPVGSSSAVSSNGGAASPGMNPDAAGGRKNINRRATASKAPSKGFGSK